MSENRLTQSPRHLIKVELMVEPGEITAKELHKILMRPAYAPGDEPTPTCEIPCIGDIIHLSDGRHAGDIAGVHVTDYYNGAIKGGDGELSTIQARKKHWHLWKALHVDYAWGCCGHHSSVDAWTYVD